ncbi:MAG: hypothetical protein R3Y49_06655 [Rikenellaceae bacterium]
MLKARIVDKYTVEVVDIATIGKQKSLDGFFDFVESEPPEVTDLDSPIPFYELRGNVVYQLWEVETDSPALINERINALKAELSATDYQVLKCYEATLTSAPSPYDLTNLTTARATLRTQINTLEQKLIE